jgi:hypothetical protein
LRATRAKITISGKPDHLHYCSIFIVKRNILQIIQRRKANWIRGISRRGCLVTNVTEGKIEGRIEVTGIRGRKLKQLNWMNLRKREDTGNLKRKHQIALSRELALEEAVGLS